MERVRAGVEEQKLSFPSNLPRVFVVPQSNKTWVP